MGSDTPPRVLVATAHNFNLVSGSGITLTNLFRGWPKDRLANLHEDPLPEDRTVCGRFYRLSDDETPRIWPVSLMAAAVGASPRPPAGDGAAADTPAASSRRLAGLGRLVFGDGVPRTARITASLDRWIREFRPTVIYTFLGSLAQIKLARALTRHYDIPLVVHVMDDWPAVAYRRGLVGRLVRPLLLREFEAALAEASAHLGISQAMCEEYRRRYGYDFVPFHNALDLAGWIDGARQTWTRPERFIVRYAGSIVADAQAHSLLEVCEAVRELRRTGRAIEMHVHAPPDESRYLRQRSDLREVLRIEPPPPASAIVRLLAGADLLVLPYNFDVRSRRYIRLSMPTKTPAYMISATPVLVYGPPEAALVRYALEGGWGQVVAEAGTAGLVRAIAALLDDEGMRARLGRRGQEVAIADHDAVRVRAAFRGVLATAAGGGGRAGCRRGR